MVSIAEELITAVKQIEEANFHDLPGMKFLFALRKMLIEKGFSFDEAEKIVSGMDIELSPGSITTEQVERLAESFSAIISKIYDTLETGGFKDPTDTVIRVANRFTLKI